MPRLTSPIFRYRGITNELTVYEIRGTCSSTIAPPRTYCGGTMAGLAVHTFGDCPPGAPAPLLLSADEKHVGACPPIVSPGDTNICTFFT